MVPRHWRIAWIVPRLPILQWHDGAIVYIFWIHKHTPIAMNLFISYSTFLCVPIMPFNAINIWVGITMPKNIICMCDIHPICEFGDISHKGERRWMVSFCFFAEHAECNKPHVWCARSLPSCCWERSINRIHFSGQAPLGCPRIAYMVIYISMFS